MKKLFLTLIGVLLLAGACIASPYWLPREYGTYDQIINTSSAVINDVSIYYKGVTVGDQIQLKNGVATTATSFYTYVAPTANGAFYYNPTKTIVADGGIYLDVTRTGGIIGISITYQ